MQWKRDSRFSKGIQCTSEFEIYCCILLDTQKWHLIVISFGSFLCNTSTSSNIFFPVLALCKPRKLFSNSIVPNHRLHSWPRQRKFVSKEERTWPSGAGKNSLTYKVAERIAQTNLVTNYATDVQSHRILTWLIRQDLERRT